MEAGGCTCVEELDCLASAANVIVAFVKLIRRSKLL